MNPIIQKLENLEFLNITEDPNATEVNQVANIPPNHKEDCEKQGIDYEASIVSTHIELAHINIAKKVFQDIVSHVTDISDINLDDIINKQIREDKIKEIFGEEITSTPRYQNVQQMQRLVFSAVQNKIRKLSANIIITNGAMGSALQDLPTFNSIYTGDSVIQSTHQYKIGSINDVTVYVDAYMRYNDNRIIIGNVDYELRHNNRLDFSDDLSELSFGHDTKINPNSKVEVLNIIDTNMFLICS